MSSLSTSLYGSSTSKGYTGLASGLDVDELVKQMSSSSRNKINRQYQAKQKLLYKQTAYREINTKLLAFSQKYLSYSSGSTTNILSPSFFKSNTIKSSSEYVNLSGDADNIRNFTINSVTNVATVASFASNKTVSDHTFSSSEITDKSSTLAGETMSIEYDGKTYNLTIDKDFGKGTDDVTLQEVTDQLNMQLARITDDNGVKFNENNEVLKYMVDGSKIKFDTSTTGETAKLSAGSTKILDVLNLKTGKTAESETDVTKSLTITKEELFMNKDAYMTFDYNGVSKTINFSKMVDKNTSTPGTYTYDAKGVSEFLQDELNNAYGDGKVTVGFNAVDNEFNFTASGETNLFGVSSISKELRNFVGVEPTTYNRINKNLAVKDSNFSTLLTPENIGTVEEPKNVFEISVNGVSFEFEETASLTEIMNKINGDTEAGVKLYYSSTTDTFTVKSKETGENQTVDIVDVKGNLGEALFGTMGVQGTDFTSIDTFLSDRLKNGETYSYNEVNENYDISDALGTKIGTVSIDNNTVTANFDDVSRNEIVTLKNYIVKQGTDTEMTYTLNGVTKSVTRSTKDFSIDGININLNEKAAGSITTENPATFTVTSNTDEVVDRVKKFVEEYNEIISLIGTKTSEKPSSGYQPLTPEQKDEMSEDEIKDWDVEAKKGMLYGDSKLNNVFNKLRNIMSSKTSVSNLSLADIGISAASYETRGKLTFNEEKFKSKLAENSDEITALFTGNSSETDAIPGLSLQIQSIMKENIGTAGTTGILIDEAGMDSSITSDDNYLSERMKEYDEKLEALKEDLEDEKERYYKKFTALEKALNNLNAQSSWLTDMMGS